MLGHTHKDIDQMFSCFSRHLSKRGAQTLLELVSEMWTNEDQVTGHINQHQFKFCHVVGKSCHFLQKMVDISKMVARQ
jgi:hypothetical protein